MSKSLAVLAIYALLTGLNAIIAIAFWWLSGVDYTAAFMVAQATITPFTAFWLAWRAGVFE